MKRASVCLATYNGEKFLRKQLDSILSQIDNRDELIIVDDASSDNTLNIIYSYNDSRIFVIKHQNNQGVVRTFETAIKISTGEYIFLCDQDDIWDSKKVETVLNDFKICRSAAIVSDAVIINDNGVVVHDSYYKFRKTRTGCMMNLIRNGYLGCTMAFDARLKSIVIPFPKQINMHDEWIGLNASLYGGVHFIPDKLIQYRRHNSNVTSLNWSGPIFAAKKRIVYAILLMFRYMIRKNN